MSLETIIDTSRQRYVTRFYILFLIGVLCVHALTLFGFLSFFNYYFMTGFLFLLVFFFSLLLGAAAKRGIDIHKTPMKTRNVTVSFDEYEKMVVKHRDFYGHLYGESGACCTLFCMLLILPALIFFTNLFVANVPIIGWPWDLLYINTILLIFASVIPYSAGYKLVGIDPDLPFKEPPSGELFEYAEDLSRVDGITPKVEVTLGESGGLLAIMDAKPTLILDNLPDTVQVKIQASYSGFTYPYLVATIFKGPQIKAHVEQVSVHARYSALFEYQMDGEVTVMVGRFDIPKETSSVPHISQSDFRKLAREVVQRLESMASS